MKISVTQPLHLSNHEVLNHFIALKRDTDNLRQQRANHDLREKLEMREKYPLVKEREATPDGSELPQSTELTRKREDEADRRGWSDELGWIEDEVIKYLCSDHLPTARQTDEGIAKLADELQDHKLTKGEVLQIINLAPTAPVELYAIIEDVDMRFAPETTELLEQIGEQVAATLLPEARPELQPFVSRTFALVGENHQTGEEYGEEGETEGYMQQEFVTEAEWGADREGGVDDDKQGEFD